MKKSIKVLFTQGKTDQGIPCTDMRISTTGKITRIEACNMLAQAILMFTEKQPTIEKP